MSAPAARFLLHTLLLAVLTLAALGGARAQSPAPSSSASPVAPSATVSPPPSPLPVASPAGTPPAPHLKPTLDVRVMPEAYDYFAPKGGYENAYGFLGVRARAGLEYNDIDWQALVQGQATLLFDLPRHGNAPSPAGALGQGASYYNLALRSDITTLGLRQVYVHVGRAGASGVQIGRFDYSQGMEVQSGDPIIDWLKNNRISKLVIGGPDYNTWGRTFDGVRADVDFAGMRLTGLVIHPTQVEPHFATDVSQVVAMHGALTFKNGLVPHGEGQIFWDQCNDTRFVSEVDDRPKKGTINAEGGNKVTTLGFHYVTRLGTDGDATVFYGHQSGRWGTQRQDAYAALAELGFRIPKGPWAPWVRGGYRIFSGDGNPNDSVHGTWIADIADARMKFNMYTNANLRELFGEIVLTPSKRENLRLALRGFRLDNPADLWYSGGGVAQDRGSNGFSGRPSGGHGDIGTLFEAFYENKIDAHNLLRLHFAQAFGGNVVRATYPLQIQGHLFYVEYHYLIP